MLVVRRKTPGGEEDEEDEIDVLNGSDGEPVDRVCFEPVTISRTMNSWNFAYLEELEEGEGRGYLGSTYVGMDTVDSTPRLEPSDTVPMELCKDAESTAEQHQQHYSEEKHLELDKEEDSADSEDEESFVVKDLKERSYYAMLERKTFQLEIEKKEQARANQWLLGTMRRSSEQLKKHKELEQFIHSPISASMDEDTQLNWDRIPAVELEPQEPRIKVLETPAWRILDEADGYNSSITEKFVKEFKLGLICADWHSSPSESPRKRNQRSSECPEQASKRQRTAHGKSPKMSNTTPEKMKNRNPDSSPEQVATDRDGKNLAKKSKKGSGPAVSISKCFRQNTWKEEESDFCRELVIAFRRDWEAVSALLWKRKTPLQIKAAFDDQCDQETEAKEKGNEDAVAKQQEVQKKEKPAGDVRIIHYQFLRITTATTTSPQIPVDQSLLGQQPALFQEDANGGRGSSRRPPVFSAKYSIGTPVFVFVQDKNRLPRGGWLEALVLDIRIASCNLKYERCEYKLRLFSKGQGKELIWMGEDNIKRTIGVGTQIFEIDVRVVSAPLTPPPTPPLSAPKVFKIKPLKPSPPSDPTPSSTTELPKIWKELSPVEESVSLLLKSLNPVDMKAALDHSSSGYNSDSSVCSMSTSLAISPTLSNPLDFALDPTNSDVLFNFSELFLEVPAFEFDENSIMNIDFVSIFAVNLSGNLRSPKVLQGNIDSLLVAINKAVDSLSRTNGLKNGHLRNSNSKDCDPFGVKPHLTESHPLNMQEMFDTCKLFFAKRELLLECGRLLQIKCKEISEETKRKAPTLSSNQDVRVLLQKSVTLLLAYKQMVIDLAVERYQVFQQYLKGPAMHTDQT